MVPGIRKVVVSTNIAATSITIDGIKYVVDSGFVKQNIFDASTGLQSLAVVPISHSEAKQRAGRAGRTSPGKCYRLYSEEVMNGYFPPTTVPEIQRSSLANVVLFLKHFGVEDVLSFSFIDPPPKKNLIEALKALVVLDALDPETGKLTQYGTKMVHFPMIPEMSKVLLEAAASNCLDEMTTIVGCLSVERIFYSHKNGCSSKLMTHHCTHYKNDAVDIMRTRRDQLYAENKEREPTLYSRILRQCFCAGYFGRAGRLVKGRSYLRTMEALFYYNTVYYRCRSFLKGRGNVVFVHPNSLFFGRESEL
ncbi:hypothetical protein Zmor_004281, partial [Zophobas morio]